MKVTVLLRNDHEALKTLFNKFGKPASVRASSGTKDLLDEILRQTRIHVQMEREILYSALSESSAAHGPSLVSKAEQQLQNVEKLMRDVSVLNVSDKTFQSAMTSLIAEVTQHIKLDEEEIFDEARKILPEYRLEELGLEMEDRRKILTTLAA